MVTARRWFNSGVSSTSDGTVSSVRPDELLSVSESIAAAEAALATFCSGTVTSGLPVRNALWASLA